MLSDGTGDLLPAHARLPTHSGVPASGRELPRAEQGLSWAVMGKGLFLILLILEFEFCHTIDHECSVHRPTSAKIEIFDSCCIREKKRFFASPHLVPLAGTLLSTVCPHTAEEDIEQETQKVWPCFERIIQRDAVPTLG